MKEKISSLLELLAKLSGYKGLHYDIELKDGRIAKLKNIKIEEVNIKDLPANIAE